jgi:hypothetical protein
MNIYPLTQIYKSQEQTIINEILKKNRYQQPNIHGKYKNKDHGNHTQGEKEIQKGKQKWATFTYTGPEFRTITNLFHHTNLKIAYKTTNTIKHLLKPRYEKPDIYNQSGVYQLQCEECSLKYIGKTGRTFRVRYREHINSIRTNKQNSKFAQHILETGYNYDTIGQIMKILHTEKKGPKLNTLGRFHILYMT